jgi:lincosamide nucleotidyltransferase A/C/D/E
LRRQLERRTRGARGSLKALAKPLARSATQLHLPLPLRWRRCPMQAADVLEVLDALRVAGVPHWVAGGWGVDALLGEQTRTHDDLDLVIGAASLLRRQRDIDAARHALEPLGYRFDADDIHLGAWFVERLTYFQRSGRRVDLLPIDERPDDFFATGLIGSREVPCLSVETQLRLHTGYPRTPADRHDVAALCSHFGLTPPRPERKMEPGWR